MIITLDSHIYDLIIATPGMTEHLNLLSTTGKIQILTTHIQEDELAKIRDSQKRADIAKIIRVKMPTSGAVYGTSQYGWSSYGDGSLGGLSPSQIRSARGNHTHDALIASTASLHCSIFVTEEKRLQRRIKQTDAQCQVWTFLQFKEFVESTNKDQANPK